MKFLRVGLLAAMLVGSLMATVAGANAQGIYVNPGYGYYNNGYYSNGYHYGWNNPYRRWRHHEFEERREAARDYWRWNRWHANRRWGWY